MHDPRFIPYYDLRSEAERGALPALIGRESEAKRLDRIALRRMESNAIIVGEAGIGKTAFVHGWMRAKALSPQGTDALLQFDAEHLFAFSADAGLTDRYTEAFAQLPPSILFIDDFGREVVHSPSLLSRVARLYEPILSRDDTHLLLALEPHEHEMLVREHPAFVKRFETITLREQPPDEIARILAAALPRLNAKHRVIIPRETLKDIVAHTERFPVLGTMPLSAVRLLDECIAHAAAQGARALSEEHIGEVVEAKTGIPRAKIASDDLESVKTLETELNARIVGQERATGRIASTLRRAKLGLRDPNRPFGSFLMLGPSGVGKTETARTVAELMFGGVGSFIRFDMSEFQQEHAAQRLIGAPSGYVGYEDGGALTNALKRDPYSLILLDEIEKAHPKVFDMFLQVLDEGRITSGRNETVSAKHAILMATSNAAVSEILDAWECGSIDDETFFEERVMPALASVFRLEFLNRFDNILVFNPLSDDALVRVAELEAKKIEKRLGKHGVRFDIDPETIREEIKHIADPRFGARPVKRFVEETCETLLAGALLKQTI